MGLIAIASKAEPGKETPAEAAFKFHWKNGRGNLRYCWLICTQDALATNLERFRAIATSSAQTATPLKLLENPDTVLQPEREAGRTVQMQTVVIDWPSAQDPNYVKYLVDRIYRQAQALSIDSQSIIADYTGGIKSTSAGVILACSTPERRLQYASGHYDETASFKAPK
ncbi:MAG: hypothetical protein HC800_23730 [Phormidesmis sp. RL_2_1]|nr:hypothetical protein [Phormidesmis sp. RL_2_1]